MLCDAGAWLKRRQGSVMAKLMVGWLPRCRTKQSVAWRRSPGKPSLAKLAYKQRQSNLTLPSIYHYPLRLPYYIGVDLFSHKADYSLDKQLHGVQSWGCTHMVTTSNTMEQATGRAVTMVSRHAGIMLVSRVSFMRGRGQVTAEFIFKNHLTHSTIVC